MPQWWAIQWVIRSRTLPLWLSTRSSSSRHCSGCWLWNWLFASPMNRDRRSATFLLLCSLSFPSSSYGAPSTACGLEQKRKLPDFQSKNKARLEIWRAFYFGLISWQISADKVFWESAQPLTAGQRLLSFSLLPSWPVFPLHPLCGPRPAIKDFRCSCPPLPLVRWPVGTAYKYRRGYLAAASC